MPRARSLNEEERAQALANIPTWEVKEGALYAEFRFLSFKDTMSFMSSVGEVAEEMDHHPHLCNVYTRVTFSLSTHDANNSITHLDIELAKKITQLAHSFHAEILTEKREIKDSETHPSAARENRTPD